MDALRGYAFQIYGSILAWIGLIEHERLYLEVAEDYATITEDALRAVQAKDTARSGSVTLNTEGVRRAIDTLIDLSGRNPERTVHLRYLSTSPIGCEARASERIEGEAGLAYWGRVAAGIAPVGPLARRLRAMDLPQRSRDFMALDDDEIRRRLVDRIHWDCGQGGVGDMRVELEARLTRVEGVHGQIVALDDAERAIALLVERVLLAATKRDSRVLTVLDLRKALHEATHVSVARADLSNLVSVAFGSGATPSGASLVPTAPPSRLDRVDDLPLPARLLGRPDSVRAVGEALAAHGVAVLCGGTGMGKSLLTRLVARAVGGVWRSLDVQTGPAPLAAERLRAALGTVEGLTGRGLIVEDLDAWEEPGVGRSLSALVAALRRSGRPCLVTTHHEPPSSVLEALGTVRDAVFQMVNLDERETGELVRLGGGEETTWRGIVWLASDGGHPQLAQAVVTDLQTRAWSQEALTEYLGDGVPRELRRERAAARRRLAAAVPDDVRPLLYRASLVLGRFDRSLALGAVEPKVPRPGEALDRLVGPWIDEVGPDQFRVSPLVGDSGEANLTPDEQRRVHQGIVGAIMSDRSINVAYADALLFHALRGGVEGALAVIALGLLKAKPADRRMLAEWSTVLRSLPTTAPIHPRTPSLSLMVRLAQFGALAIKGDDGRLGECARALVGELADLPVAARRGPIEVAVLTHILLERRLGAVMRDAWPDLLARLGGLVGDDVTPEEVKAAFGHAGHGSTLLGMAFAVQCSAIGGVAGLGVVFDRIAAMTPERREVVLRAAEGLSGGLGQVVKRPIVEEHDEGTLDWRAAAAAYLRMSRQATGWGGRSLSLHCVAAGAMVTDETGEAPDEALGILERAEAEVGPDRILTRARAKVLWRRRDHAAALPLLLRCMERLEDEGVVEGAFLAREAAMSAAALGDHASARDCFDEARRCADSASEAMTAMSVGLAADAAVSEMLLGRGREGVLRFAGCLERLASLDPRGDVKAAYAHKVITHAILWAYGHLTGTPVPLSDGPARIAPGACSAPDPPADVDARGHSLDFPWCLLALSDVDRDLDAGVDARLHARLSGPPAQRLEVMLRQARMTRAIRHRDRSGFLREFEPWIEAVVFRLGDRRGAEAMGTWDSSAAVLPRIGVDGWGGQQVRGAALAALTAFALTAATAGEREALDDLEAKLVAGSPAADVLRGDLARMTTRTTRFEGRMVDAADVVASLALDHPRDPRHAMIISIRLLEAADDIVGYGFGGVVGPALAGWIGAEWSRIAIRQAYGLINPRTSVPAIMEAVRGSKGDVGSAARIVLTALPAVKVGLDGRLRARLSAMASPG